MSNGDIIRGQFRDDYTDIPFNESATPVILTKVESSRTLSHGLTVDIKDLSDNTNTYAIINIQRGASGIALVVLKKQ